MVYFKVLGGVLGEDQYDEWKPLMHMLPLHLSSSDRLPPLFLLYSSFLLPPVLCVDDWIRKLLLLLPETRLWVRQDVGVSPTCV